MFAVVAVAGGGRLFEVFGRRLVSRVLFSLVLLLVNGGVFFTFLNITLLLQVDFLYISCFYPPLYETEPGHERGTEGGLMS